MNIEIRRLTSELAEAYVQFFDRTPHDDSVDEHKCYCVCWCSDDCSGDYESRNLSSREKRRRYALQCVRDGRLQGYLAYCGDEIIGWCNANSKPDCLNCYGWRKYRSDVSTDKDGTGLNVKSIFCFLTAPEMKRKGVATQLLKRVCEDAAREGFKIVEAYPQRTFGRTDNCGPFELYEKLGFTVYCETERGPVMRKQLK